MEDSKMVEDSTLSASPNTAHVSENSSVWSDFLATIKIGIVNSNFITTFTGFWLALFFNERHFLENLDKAFFTLIGSSLIIAGSCSLNNYIDRDIDPLMERTKGRPTVTGNF